MDKLFKNDENGNFVLSESLNIKKLFNVDFNSVDAKVAKMFDEKNRPYRWAYIFVLAVLVLFLLTSFLYSQSVVESKAIIVQLPAPVPVPTTIQLPVISQPSTMPSTMPINITDIKNIPELKKLGGYNSLLNDLELETSLFSDLNETEF